MSNTLEAASTYLSLGWMPIPLLGRSKNPNRKGWQKERWSPEDLPRCFNNGQNIGLLLGQPSSGLVDVDLDCTEAISIADYILPVTGMISGRAGSPASHRWYVCNPPVTTTQFRDPTLSKTDDRAMIAELRSTGGQTVVPPSIHPSGDIYEWNGELSPALVSGQDLLRDVRRLAACALVARHWSRGQRQHTALALAGALFRAGWPLNSVEKFIRLVTIAACDKEAEDRIRAVAPTEQKIIAGEKATGLPSLAALIGEKVISTLQKWLTLKISTSERTAEPNHEGDGLIRFSMRQFVGLQLL